MLQKGLALALLARRARRTLSALQTMPQTVLGAKANRAIIVEADFMIPLD